MANLTLIVLIPVLVVAVNLTLLVNFAQADGQVDCSWLAKYQDLKDNKDGREKSVALINAILKIFKSPDCKPFGDPDTGAKIRDICNFEKWAEREDTEARDVDRRFCQAYESDSIRSKLDNDKKGLYKIINLVNFVDRSESIEGYLGYKSDEISPGVAKYLATKGKEDGFPLHPSKCGFRVFHYFGYLYKNHVVTPCNEWVTATNNFRDWAERALDDLEEVVNEEEKIWLKSRILCQSITTIKNLKNDVQKFVNENFPKEQTETC